MFLKNMMVEVIDNLFFDFDLLVEGKKKIYMIEIKFEFKVLNL